MSSTLWAVPKAGAEEAASVVNASFGLISVYVSISRYLIV
jgi:hypothetical protein